MKRGSVNAAIIPALFAVGWVVFRLSMKRQPGASLGQLLVEFFPVIVAGGVALFLATSNARQQRGILLGLLLPGLGHLKSGFRSRGLFFLGCVVSLFVVGLLLGRFANVSPLDRHPIWGIAQAPAGLLTALVAFATRSVMIVGDNPYYQIGCLYTGVAGLLNVVALCDLWDLLGTAGGAKDTPPLTPPAGGPAA